MGMHQITNTGMFFASQVSKDDSTPAEIERGIGYPEYRYHGEQIWGTTASIVANFVGILIKGGQICC